MLPPFLMLPEFLSKTLPDLVPDSARLAHVLVSNRQIGLPHIAHRWEVRHRDNGLTRVCFHHATIANVGDLPEIFGKHVPREVPVIANVYLDVRAFDDMWVFVERFRQLRSDASIVALVCRCVTDPQIETLATAIENGMLRHVVWAPCGAMKAMGDIRDAVAREWIGLPPIRPKEMRQTLDA